MEKAIIIFCLALGISCSGLEEKDNSEMDSSGKTQRKSVGYCAELENSNVEMGLAYKEVQWMYLDDSLKSICRPLNFRLPWMASDIKLLPELITPEILNLSPVKTFELIGKSKDTLNDSVYYFHYLLQKQYCRCEVFRFYLGNAADKNFEGYKITEQIICNARSNEVDLSADSKASIPKEKKEESGSYEVKGHEH